MRALGVEPQEELRSARSSDELASLAGRSASEGTLDSETAHLVQRSVAFGPRTAGEIMTPRVQMACVDATDPVSEVIELSSTTGFSKFPVIKGTSDNVVGSVHVKQAVAVPRSERAHTLVREVMVDATVVPESLRLDPLLSLLRGEGFQMAIVSDEYGGTAGVVTLEDVVEEIVGDIADEHDRYGSRLRQRPDGSWIVSGLLRPDEVGRRHRPRSSPRTRPTTPWPACSSASSAGSRRVATRCWCRCRSCIPEDDDEEPVQEHALLRVERMDGLRVDRISIKRLLPQPDAAREDPMSTQAALWLGLVLLLGNAFFVGAEFALVSARRTKVEPKAAAGSRVARTTLRAMEGLSQMIAAAQFGITVCSLGLGAVAEPALAHLIEPVAEAVQPARRLAAPGRVHASRWPSWSTCTSCWARWCPRTSPSPAPSGRRWCSARRWWRS